MSTEYGDQPRRRWTAVGTGYVRDKLGHIVKVNWIRQPRRRWAVVTPINTKQAASRLKPRWIHQIFADPECTIPVLDVDAPNKSGLWWADDHGVIQRVATYIETSAKAKPPKPGWTLVDGILTVSEAKTLFKIQSPEEREHESAVRLYKSCEADLERSRRFLTRAERRLKLAQANFQKWSRMVTKLERRLSSRGEKVASTKHAIDKAEVTK